MYAFRKLNVKIHCLLLLSHIHSSSISGFSKLVHSKGRNWKFFRLFWSSTLSFSEMRSLNKLFLLLEILWKRNKILRLWNKNLSQKWKMHGLRYLNQQINHMCNSKMSFNWLSSSCPQNYRSVRSKILRKGWRI